MIPIPGGVRVWIAKLERQIYGQRSERSSRLIDQLALTFEELEADATEDELAAEQAVARTRRGIRRQRAVGRSGAHFETQGFDIVGMG